MSQEKLQESRISRLIIFLGEMAWDVNEKKKNGISATRGGLRICSHEAVIDWLKVTYAKSLELNK